MSKLLDNGNDAGRMNLILVGDGYTTDDRALFERHAVQLSKQIQSESWYRQGILNLHTAWIVSAERAPTEPTGKPNNTAFKAYYGGGRAAHVISGDDGLAKTSAAIEVALGAPQHVIVLVNSTLYGGKGGGKGGNICWTYTDSRNPARWTSCALHELGHSLFGLADEYGGPLAGGWVKEPDYPNITLDRRGAKWRHLVTGAYEGGGGYSVGVWRPTLNCRMRTLTGFPFCPVCEDAARRTLEGYISGEPEPERLIRITVPGEEGKDYPDNSAGAMEAVQWLLKRQFG